jgi:hypothetical protein
MITGFAAEGQKKQAKGITTAAARTKLRKLYPTIAA